MAIASYGSQCESTALAHKPREQSGSKGANGTIARQPAAGSAGCKGGHVAPIAPEPANARQKWLQAVASFGKMIAAEKAGGLPYGDGEPVTLPMLNSIMKARYPVRFNRTSERGSFRAYRREDETIKLSKKAVALVNAPLPNGEAPSPSDKMFQLAGLANNVIRTTGLCNVNPTKPSNEQLTDRILLNFIITQCAEEIIKDGDNCRELRRYLRDAVASLDEGQINFCLGPTLSWLDDTEQKDNAKKQKEIDARKENDARQKEREFIVMAAKFGADAPLLSEIRDKVNELNSVRGDSADDDLLRRRIEIDIHVLIARKLSPLDPKFAEKTGEDPKVAKETGEHIIIAFSGDDEHYRFVRQLVRNTFADFSINSGVAFLSEITEKVNELNAAHGSDGLLSIRTERDILSLLKIKLSSLDPKDAIALGEGIIAGFNKQNEGNRYVRGAVRILFERLSLESEMAALSKKVDELYATNSSEERQMIEKSIQVSLFLMLSSSDPDARKAEGGHIQKVFGSEDSASRYVSRTVQIILHNNSSSEGLIATAK
jgi:hypothetical protein